MLADRNSLSICQTRFASLYNWITRLDILKTKCLRTTIGSDQMLLHTDAHNNCVDNCMQQLNLNFTGLIVRFRF